MNKPKHSPSSINDPTSEAFKLRFDRALSVVDLEIADSEEQERRFTNAGDFVKLCMKRRTRLLVLKRNELITNANRAGVAEVIAFNSIIK